MLLCDKPKQCGETDIITFFAGEEHGEPVLKSKDVCHDCQTWPIIEPLSKMTDLSHVFQVSLSVQAAAALLGQRVRHHAVGRWPAVPVDQRCRRLRACGRPGAV